MLSLNGADLRHALEMLYKKSENLYSQFQRVNQHIIAGPLLKFLRWAKHDKTFGNPDEPS
jgi:hypothetical protein